MAGVVFDMHVKGGDPSAHAQGANSQIVDFFIYKTIYR
jgi:hypothetical protein